VDIRSKPLKEALKHIMSEVKGVSLVQETPHIDPNMLFLYLEETRAYMKELKQASKSEKKRKARKAAAAKAAHLKVLIKYLDKDYAETKKTLYPLLENKMITFDLLWALYKPNTIAYCATYGDHDQPRAFKIDYATKDSHFMKGVWYSIEGRYLEYDGKSFGMGTMHTDVMSFTGSRKISSLDCYPLQYHKDPEGVRATLIERGKKFAALKGMNYRYHKGMAYTKRKRQILKININGRVMIDPAIHRRINPNYPISTVKPKDDADVYEPSDAGSEDDSCRCGGHSSSDDPEGDRNTPSSSEDTKQQRKKFKVVKDEQGQHHLVEIETDDNGEEIIQKEKLGALGQGVEEAFSDEELLIASPVVLGFAFSEKLWLEFTVSGISDVIWNEGAFDSLVLPDNQKSIVKALVSSHAFHPSRSIDDIIVGKGKGLVAVLHGPPGTGKTLTAEGIADLLKCPLYMVSAGDLGTDPRTLEKELQNILGMYPSSFLSWFHIC
jgi:ATPase family associated with various cellular activities (AAA)